MCYDYDTLLVGTKDLECLYWVCLNDISLFGTFKQTIGHVKLGIDKAIPGPVLQTIK